MIIKLDTATPLSLLDREIMRLLLKAWGERVLSDVTVGVDFDPAAAARAFGVQEDDEDDGDADYAEPGAFSVTPPAPATLASSSQPGDLDGAGFPWDERIHAESRTKTQDGRWRKKRGADPALIAQIEAAYAPAAVVLPAPPPPAALAPPLTVLPVAGVAPQFIAPQPVAPPAPTAPPAGTADFSMLLGRCAAALEAKQITPERLAEIIRQHGATELTGLAQASAETIKSVMDWVNYIANHPGA